jgi:hypothetical protein
MKVEKNIYDIISNIWSNLDYNFGRIWLFWRENFEILKLIFHFFILWVINGFIG